MPLVTVGYNALLSGGLSNVINSASLHSGDPGTTGVNELTGGSPAYSRQTVTWAAVGSGQISTNATLTWNVPASTTVYHVGLWNSTGPVFYGYFPVGGYAAVDASAVGSTGVFTSPSHGYSNTQQVLVYNIQNGTVPVGLTEGTVYFVTGATTNTFTLALTSGGATITGGVDGVAAVQRVLPEVFAGQGQYQILSGSLTLDARFV
jgi:hypothetical protein